MSNKTVKKKNKKKDRDKKKILFFILKATIGTMILSGFLYFFVIPPRFNVVEKVAPEELVYEEMVLTVRTNKPLKLLSLDENWLDNYMQNYVYKNYHLDPTIYDFSYEQKGSEYIAKLTPKYNNMHEECYMTEFKDADMDIEDYVMAFLIQSRAKFVLDIKGNIGG